MSRFLHFHSDKHDRAYAPSFFEPDSTGFLNPEQASLTELLGDVTGKLQAADHYKLYEAGYFSDGPVLEIGRSFGKSTIVLGLGIRKGARPGPFISIEINDKLLERAKANLARFGLLDQIQLVQGRSSEKIVQLNIVYDTAFVDGDHSYEGVLRDLDALKGRVRKGGVVMFHDYFDARNEDPTEPTYGVRQAVDKRASDLKLLFRGRFGAIALFAQG